MQPTGRPYLRYSDDVETIDPDEAQTFERIVDVMGKGGEIRRWAPCRRTVPSSGTPV